MKLDGRILSTRVELELAQQCLEKALCAIRFHFIDPEHCEEALHIAVDCIKQAHCKLLPHCDESLFVIAEEVKRNERRKNLSAAADQ